MANEVTFRVDHGVNLPLDTKILYYDPELPSASGGCGTTCASCAGQKKPHSTHAVENKFLAVSASTASYVVFDRDMLESVKSLQNGDTIQSVRCALQRRLGHEEGHQKLISLLRNIVGRNFFANASVEEYRPKQAVMQMYVTNRCNLRCRHCYMSSGDALPHGEVSTADRLWTIDTFAMFAPGSKITFTGGEALLDPDIFVLLKHARSRGLQIELFSNGLTIKNAQFAERLIELVDILQVSIDGTDEKSNDAVRGKGTFTKIVRGIRLLDEAKHKLNLPNFRMRLAMTLTSVTAETIREDMPRFIEFLRLKKRPEIRVGTVGKLGRAKENPDLVEDHNNLQLAQADIVNEFARSGMHRMEIAAVNRFMKTCGMGLSVTVGADGNIYPCSITDQKPIGNIRDPDAAAALASVATYTHSTNVDNVEGCRKCDIRYFCGGICRITNDYEKGSMRISACTPAYKNMQVRNLIARYESYRLS